MLRRVVLVALLLVACSETSPLDGGTKTSPDATADAGVRDRAAHTDKTSLDLNAGVRRVE